jgi:replication factor C subunit 3/5
MIRFCLICNYENKIIPAIRSRCANFRFNNLDIKHIKIKLEQICKYEKLTYDLKVINTIAYLARGDLRKGINLLQTIAMQTNHLTVKLCYENAGVPLDTETKSMLLILIDDNYDFNTTYNYIKNITIDNGYALSIIIKELLQFIINDSTILINSAQIIVDLSDLENMVTKSTFNDIYISYLIGILKKKNIFKKID